MLRFLRPRWLDLVLVAAVASLLGYLEWYAAVGSGSPWAALWPNITADLFFVWLAARVIDGLGEARQRRLSAVGGLRGALNHLMRQASDLLPDLYPWRIRDLKDELRWFHLRLERSKALKRDEVQRAKDIVGSIPELLRLAEEVRSTRAETARLQAQLDDDWKAERERAASAGTPDLPHRHEASWLDSLEREYHSYVGDTEADQGPLRVEVAECRRQIDALDPGKDLSSLLHRYVTAVELQLTTTESLRADVASLISSIRDNEMTLLERARD